MTDYERAALGAMIVWGELVPDALKSLEPGMFTHAYLPSIVSAMGTLVASGKPVDWVTLPEALRAQGSSEPPKGWPVFMSELCHDRGGSSKHIDYYVSEIRRAYFGRQIIALAKQIAEDPDVPEVVEQLQKTAVARDAEVMAKCFDFTKDLGSYLDGLEPKKSANATVRVGMESLDEILGGLRPGDLMAVAGRPGGGKTALMTKIGVNVAKTGVKVAIFSTEMRATQFVDRVMAFSARVPAWRFRAMRFEEEHWRLLRDACAEMHAHQLWVFDDPRPSINSIRSVVLKFRPTVLIVDYLQRCARPKAENVTRSTDEFMTQLKSLCMEYAAIGIIGCQLSRAVDRDNGPPRLADLRDSGAIEAECDQVVLLQNNQGDIRAYVEKNRHGPTGVANLILDKQFVDIREATDGNHDQVDGGGAKRTNPTDALWQSDKSASRKEVLPSMGPVPQHGLNRKDLMAGNAYQPETEP